MDWGITSFNGETIGHFFFFFCYFSLSQGEGVFGENRWFMGEFFKGLLGAKFNKVIGGFLFHLLFHSLRIVLRCVLCVRLAILPLQKDCLDGSLL